MLLLLVISSLINLNLNIVIINEKYVSKLFWKVKTIKYDILNNICIFC